MENWMHVIFPLGVIVWGITSLSVLLEMLKDLLEAEGLNQTPNQKVNKDG